MKIIYINNKIIRCIISENTLRIFYFIFGAWETIKSFFKTKVFIVHINMNENNGLKFKVLPTFKMHKAWHFNDIVQDIYTCIHYYFYKLLSEYFKGQLTSQISISPKYRLVVRCQNIFSLNSR